jgi:predicted ATPase
MINKIGVENFRGFKDNTEFELAPITILTGPNNSGKSSFLKLLDLLNVSFGTNKNFTKLSFDQGNHNLGTFDKVVNWESSNNEIKLTFPFPLEYFDEDFNLELIYGSLNENGELKSFKICNKKRVLILINDLSKRVDDIGFDCKMDLDYLKKVFNQNTICKEEESYSKDIRRAFKEFNDKQPLKTYTDTEERIHSMVNIISQAELGGDYAEPEQRKDILKIDEFTKKFFNKEYSELANRNELIPISYFEDKKYSKNKEFYEEEFGVKLDDKTILEKEAVFFNNLDYNAFSVWFNENDDNFINEMFLDEGIGLDDFYYIFNFRFEVEDFEIIWPKDDQIKYFKKYFIKSIAKSLNIMNLWFDQVHFVSASRGNKNRILSNKSSNDIDEIVKEFHELDINEEDELFLKESLNILEVKGSILIERIEGVASVIYLEQNDKKISLSDLGYGYSQIIPILLKVLVVSRSTERLNNRMYSITKDYERVNYCNIIIEEPEANLHPNLQSKLADVLVLAYQRFGIHFILETHSEYLIRKLQYLTAKGEIKEGDVNIYYYNDDRYVTKEEPKVKKIKIDEYGGLTDSFGPGFFDEATKLQFELLKLNKGQSN